MIIYRNEFVPTYLYIKQHSITGKLYFGKTIQNPEKYYGSGVHWLRHIEKHGKEYVITLWYCLFLDKSSIQDFSINFSEQQNIIESNDWLNLIIENGLDGCPVGTKFTKEHCDNISKSKIGKENEKISGENHYMYGKHLSLDRKIRQSIAVSGPNNPMFGKEGAMKGKHHSEEAKRKSSLSNTGQSRTSITKKNISESAKKTYDNGRVANCAKSVVVNGITYDSLKEAEEITGISKYKLRKLLLKI
jgi:hypothetical protein